jgi:tetratricopeptide (TPR) repeat protein
MPPWLPQPGFGDFQNERKLTEAQIQTIAAWVKAGAPQGTGEPPPTPAISQTKWALGKPDLVMIAQSSFTVPAAGGDVFWNFTFDPSLSATRYVRAVDIQPGIASRLVHHANVLLDRTGSAARLERTPGGGFPGMELVLDRNPFDPESHFVFWKPGSPVYEEPSGLSWRLDPGNRLILNTHLQPGGKAESIRPVIGLYFTDKPPTRFPLLMELENDNALEIPAGASSFSVSDDFKLPLDVDVLAIYPHAHYLGKVLEAYATLPDNARVWLTRIPDWDLNWQAVYRYRTPVFLPKGSVISMRFSYDNSSSNPRNPNHPPKRVEAGNRASDEMGHLWLQVLPRGPGDRRRPLQEALLRHRLEKVPEDATAHLNLGAILMSRLETNAAIGELQSAIRLKPGLPEAHDMLGSAYRSVGRSMDAMDEYRKALRIDPGYINARYNLATTLARAGKLQEAIPDFRAVVEAFPKSGRLHNEFGEVLAESGDLRGALAEFDKALELSPSDSYALKNRALVTQRLKTALSEP